MPPRHVHRERVRFGDLDAMRHLNNVVLLDRKSVV
jgi:acyl-CoA thioesterase FadM